MSDLLELTTFSRQSCTRGINVANSAVNHSLILL